MEVPPSTHPQKTSGKRRPQTSEPQPPLPFSEDSEKGLICSLLLAPGEVMKQCAQRINADSFYIPAHRLLFDTIRAWPHPNKKVDFVWLKETLEEREQLAEVGGKEGLNEFFSFVHTPAN